MTGIVGYDIQYSYDFVVFCCVGPLALPKKDKIDPWRLAMLGIGSVRPDNCATVFLPEMRSLHWFCSRFCNSTCFWLILFVGWVPMAFCCITVVTVACSR
jgi:hypothetical protein